MANKKISEGVGKKIVEALKKQSEIEINVATMNKETESDELESLSDSLDTAFDETSSKPQENFPEGDFLENLPEENILETLSDTTEDAPFNLNESQAKPQGQPFAGYQQPLPSVNESIIKELDNFEIPSNIAVLKKLISQLPSGVTRHTGAQIIKQTMEALGISMKSVLQEAQQVQDGLNNSAKECFSSIQEYKKQIVLLEKQAQNYQKQYAALNELISLFIQTGV